MKVPPGLCLECADIFFENLQINTDLVNNYGDDSAAVLAALDVLAKVMKVATLIQQSTKVLWRLTKDSMPRKRN